METWFPVTSTCLVYYLIIALTAKQLCSISEKNFANKLWISSNVSPSYFLLLFCMNCFSLKYCTRPGEPFLNVNLSETPCLDPAPQMWNDAWAMVTNISQLFQLLRNFSQDLVSLAFILVVFKIMGWKSSMVFYCSLVSSESYSIIIPIKSLLFRLVL